MQFHIHFQIVGYECPFIRRFIDEFRGRFARAMPGLRLDANQDGRGSAWSACIVAAYLKLCAGHHAVVVIGRRDQGRRIFSSRLNIVQRRIGVERLEFLGIVAAIRNPTSRPSQW